MGGLDKPLETMYNRNSHMHNYNRNSHVHNALQKILWHFQKCMLGKEWPAITCARLSTRLKLF